MLMWIKQVTLKTVQITLILFPLVVKYPKVKLVNAELHLVPKVTVEAVIKAKPIHC